MAAVAALVVAAALIAGCGEKLPTGPASAPPPGAVRGVTLADWSARGYGRPSAKRSIEEIASTGANLITIVITAYQTSTGSSRLVPDDRRTARPEAVLEAIGNARALGLDVALKPHVDLYDESWRGSISPADPAAWFDDYEAFVLPWADVAESTGVSLFLVGTELAGTLDHESSWRRVIADVRGRFGGAVTYAASWDEADRVPFWDDLDYLGVDVYFPVADRSGAGRLELLAGWQPWLDRLGRLRHRAGDLPVLFTEIGYRSVRGAGGEPWAFSGEAAVDLNEQANLYWAALQAASEEEWIAGLVWWNWLASGGGGTDDTDFTPRGKPAEDELRAAWGGR